MTAYVLIERYECKLSTPFSMKDAIKELPERKWDPETRKWIVPTVFLPQIELMFKRVGVEPHWDDRRALTSSGSRGGDWAAQMFKAVPDHLHDALFRQMTRVLHPDMGGDLRSMQTLMNSRTK